MKPSDRTIKRWLKELRELIDTTDDPVVSRIAYAMENAVRLATEDTTDWGSLADEAEAEANLLKSEGGIDQ